MNYSHGFGGHNCSTGILSGFYASKAGEAGVKDLVDQITKAMADCDANTVAVTNTNQDKLAGEALRRFGFVAVLKAPGCHGGFQTFYAYNRVGGGQLAPQIKEHKVPGWIVPEADKDAYQKPEKNCGEHGLLGNGDNMLQKEVERLKKALEKAEKANEGLVDELDAARLKLTTAVKPPARAKVRKVSRFDTVTKRTKLRRIG